MKQVIAERLDVDVYLVNGRKLKPERRVYHLTNTSRSLLDDPRTKSCYCSNEAAQF